MLSMHILIKLKHKNYKCRAIFNDISQNIKNMKLTININPLEKRCFINFSCFFDRLELVWTACCRKTLFRANKSTILKNRVLLWRLSTQFIFSSLLLVNFDFSGPPKITKMDLALGHTTLFLENRHNTLL